MDINSKATLNNGVEIPLFGLGVYKSVPGKETEQAVKWALEAGYRHIDTAAFYANEKDVGKAIRDSKIPRDEIFVTTKLWNDDHGYDKTLKAFDKSLKKLNIGYVDLYLIHWPVEKIRKETWKAMEKIYADGKCRAIGISNYMIRHIDELFSYANVIPAVNQVEFSPYLYLKDLQEYCKKHEILLESYSPLTRGKKLDDPRLVEIAKKYVKTPAQILIRWALQHEVVVIPKSVKKERIYENANVFDFEISQRDMQNLDSFSENFRDCWDPSNAP